MKYTGVVVVQPMGNYNNPVNGLGNNLYSYGGNNQAYVNEMSSHRAGNLYNNSHVIVHDNMQYANQRGYNNYV
jgi:hypothetical protein